MFTLRTASRITAFAWFFVIASLLSAAPADLEKIDRRIAREPAYQDQPGYCLLVFGSKAKSKTWLVRDGKTLYVDRNANGDLTEASERFEPKNRRDLNNSEGGYRDWQYEIGDLEPVSDGTKHTRFEVKAYQLGDAPVCYVVSLCSKAINGRAKVTVSLPGLTPIELADPVLEIKVED